MCSKAPESDKHVANLWQTQRVKPELNSKKLVGHKRDSRSRLIDTPALEDFLLPAAVNFD
jgi:hypothetical protein